MKRINYLILFVALTMFLLNSCASKRNLVYFSDLTDSLVYVAPITNEIEPKIKSDDILSIKVNTLNPESNSLFNQGVVPTMSSSSNAPLSNPGFDGYLVDHDGNINFPVIGKIKLAGLTREEARQEMVKRISEHVKDPIVNIRFINFRITVVGEVSSSGSFVVPNEKINIIEGLGLAGDITPYGKRENVLIIREQEGQRTMARLNLNQKSALASPFFYLQPNDIIYVEPHKLKNRQTSDTLRLVSFTLSTLSIILVIATRLN